jgi:hypothetical protein
MDVTITTGGTGGIASVFGTLTNAERGFSTVQVDQDSPEN